MKYKTMLKKYAAETNDKVKDRMMLIIKIKHDSTDICEAVRSLGKSDSWVQVARKVQTGRLMAWMTNRALAGRPK